MYLCVFATSDSIYTAAQIFGISTLLLFQRIEGKNEESETKCLWKRAMLEINLRVIVIRNIPVLIVFISIVYRNSRHSAQDRLRFTSCSLTTVLLTNIAY